MTDIHATPPAHEGTPIVTGAEQQWPRTIAILGAAGTVGSSVAAQLALNGIGESLFLLDIRDGLLASHVIDLSDAQTLVGVDRPRLVPDAPADGAVDVIIVAASRPEDPDGDRRAFVNANVDLLATLVPRIETLAGRDGLVILLSNPVDILAGWLAEHSALLPERILGYSLNDSARFRSAVAHVVGVEASRVSGIVLGEHGDGQVPLFSSLRLDGEPLALSADQRTEVATSLDGWFRRWSALKAGRSSGWATGTGMRCLLQELAAGRTVVSTATTAGLPGYPRSFIALEVQRTSAGISVQLPEVDPSESDELRASAERIREQIDALRTRGDATTSSGHEAEGIRR